MESPKTLAYGKGRASRKIAISYGEIERAAFAILKSGRRPTVQNVRDQIGHGSPQSVLNSLNRFWADLGPRLEGDPAALNRLPSDIAELADGMWQRALALASQAARQTDNGARQRLQEIQIENDLRAQSFALREKELETAARAREQALADAQEHLLLMMKSLGREQTNLKARDAHIAALESEVANYRQQLSKVIARAAQGHRDNRRSGQGVRKKPAGKSLHAKSAVSANRKGLKESTPARHSKRKSVGRSRR